LTVNTSQKKKPLLYIGLIAFLAIAVIGILYDFISQSGGIVAIISVVVAFLILAVMLVIDAVARKREADAMDEDDPFAAAQLADSRFLRHTEESSDEDSGNDYIWRPNGARSGFAGFGRRGFEDAEASADSAGDQIASDDQFAGFDQPTADAPANFGPSADASFGFDASDDDDLDFDSDFDTEFSDVQSAAIEETAADPVQEPASHISFEQPSTVETAVQPEPEENDIFKPVLKLTGSEPQPEPQPAAPSEPQNIVEEQPAEPVVAAAAPVKTVEEPARAEKPAPKPTAAERRAAAAVPAASVAASMVGGQSIESFYDEMTDEDILYRDCVEVWAADAKPSALRLIKYVEGIEDKQTAAMIGREVEYLNAMIDRINCFTQLEYIDELLEYRQHNYSTLVKDCLKRFSPFFMEKRLGLLWKGLDIEVMTDRRWFIFALTQVIFNAVEFTPNGGKIAISAKKHENYIDLTVEDSGKGISPDELPFIFMAGYMGDDAPNENGGRTGMGLFIAQSVMRKMGGEMLAESTPGKGTRVTMRMPIIEPNA